MWNFMPCRITSHSSLPAVFTDGKHLVGAENDAGYVRYYNPNITKYVITAVPNVYLFGVDVGSIHLALQPSLINSEPWWKYNTNYVVFKSLTFGWVYSESLVEGYEPIEYQDDLGAWQGDSFWACADLPTIVATPSTMTARGSEHGGATKTISLADTPRWECSTSAGTYTAAGGAAGTKTVGAAIQQKSTVYVCEKAVMQ
jgi:hypothetical protein